MSLNNFFRAYDRVLATWPVAVEAIEIESRFGTTHINACGPSDGAPVVLLPGGGATSTVWFANVAALSRHHRVYAVDPIGQPGRSVVGSVPIRRPSDLLSWLGGVLDGLDLDSVDLMGHSYGAMIALAYRVNSPDRVRNLVLLDPNSCFAGMRASYLAHAIPLLLRPTYRRERALIDWETDGAELDSDWLDLVGRGAGDHGPSKMVVPSKPTTTALESLTNTTVLLAARSKVHNAVRVAAKIPPNIATHVVPGCSHHTMPMHPSDEIDQYVLSALG